VIEYMTGYDGYLMRHHQALINVFDATLIFHAMATPHLLHSSEIGCHLGWGNKYCVLTTKFTHPSTTAIDMVLKAVHSHPLHCSKVNTTSLKFKICLELHRRRMSPSLTASIMCITQSQALNPNPLSSVLQDPQPWSWIHGPIVVRQVSNPSPQSCAMRLIAASSMTGDLTS
jgi:hypothetical protein